MTGVEHIIVQLGAKYCRKSNLLRTYWQTERNFVLFERTRELSSVFPQNYVLVSRYIRTKFNESTFSFSWF